MDPFKTGGGETLAHKMNVRFLGRIPLDMEVVRAGDAGVSLVRDRPQSPAAKAFAHVVDSILACNNDLAFRFPTLGDQIAMCSTEVATCWG